MTFDHRRITGPDCLGRRARWSSVCVLQHAHWPTTEGHSTDLCVHASRDRADRDSTSLGQICKPASSLKQMAPPTSRLRERKSRVRCQFGLWSLRSVIAELMDHTLQLRSSSAQKRCIQRQGSFKCRGQVCAIRYKDATRSKQGVFCH